MINTYDYIIEKYHLSPGIQYFVEIPNMGRNDLAKLFWGLEFTKGVEIGVDRGEYSEILCAANPKLHLTSIDAYTEDSYDPGIAAVPEAQKYLDGIYEEAKKRLAPYNCTLIKKRSMDAVSEFPDGSVDFVYIDGAHDFMNVTNDIHFWLKKVRVGGILAGHDYARFPSRKNNHVKKVVDSYFSSYHMFPYFIVGAFTYDEGFVRDRFRSWFWVKK